QTCLNRHLSILGMNVAPVDGATFITHRTRSETDSFGPIDVAADRYWGAQTEQSRRNFHIGQDRMPIPIVHALAMVKLAAAVRQPHCHHGRGSQGAFRTERLQAIAGILYD